MYHNISVCSMSIEVEVKVAGRRVRTRRLIDASKSQTRALNELQPVKPPTYIIGDCWHAIHHGRLVVQQPYHYEVSHLHLMIFSTTKRRRYSTWTAIQGCSNTVSLPSPLPSILCLMRPHGHLTPHVPPSSAPLVAARNMKQCRHRQ